MESVNIPVSRQPLWLANTIIATALALLVAVTAWDLVKDHRANHREAAILAIKSARREAVRTAGRVAQVAESAGATSLGGIQPEILAGPMEALDADVGQRFSYTAIVDPEGRIVRHTSPEREGRRLGRDWYESVAYDLGGELVRTRSAALTAGTLVYDIHVPIVLHGRERGSVHVGIGGEQLRQLTARHEPGFPVGSLLAGGLVVVLVAAAAGSLYSLTRGTLVLRDAVTKTYMRAASELGRLAAGLAHEIRNPLHALRLNLHAFRRARENPQSLSSEEIQGILDDSTREIERIDELLQQVINFASSSKPRSEAFNLNSELENVVDFIGQELRRSGVDVRLTLPDAPVSIRMDPARLRQVMLNLLHNARDSMPQGGSIDVRLEHEPGRVQIAVADQGKGIAEADRPRIFEPFYSTGEDGMGLGLALVKRFVEEAGGAIRCEPNQPHGSRFLIQLAEPSSAELHA